MQPWGPCLNPDAVMKGLQCPVKASSFGQRCRPSNNSFPRSRFTTNAWEVKWNDTCKTIMIQLYNKIGIGFGFWSTAIREIFGSLGNRKGILTNRPCLDFGLSPIGRPGSRATSRWNMPPPSAISTLSILIWSVVVAAHHMEQLAEIRTFGWCTALLVLREGREAQFTFIDEVPLKKHIPMLNCHCSSLFLNPIPRMSRCTVDSLAWISDLWIPWSCHVSWMWFYCNEINITNIHQQHI